MSSSLCVEIKSFFKEHKALCLATGGLAVAVYAVGRLGVRAVTIIRECFGITKRADEVGRDRIAHSEIATSGKFYFQDNEFNHRIITTAPELFPANKDYFVLMVTTRLTANFDENQFNRWRNGKENPVILAITPGTLDNANICPSEYLEVPVVQLFCRLEGGGGLSLGHEDVQRVNADCINRLSQSPEQFS